MPTPEELQKQIEDQQKQIEEFKAKGAKADALEVQVKSLSDNLTKVQDDNKKKDSEIAVRDAVTEFPYAKDFKDLLRGNTAEEIKASAKAIHDKQLEILKSRGVDVTNNGLDAWRGVPGSVPPELLISSSRDEEYAKVKASALPKRQKIAALMGMHIEDLYKRHVLDVRKRLGVR